MSSKDEEYLSDLYKFRKKLERSDMNKNVMKSDGAYFNESSSSLSEASTSSSPDHQKLLLRLNLLPFYAFFSSTNLFIMKILIENKL